jgi:pimeloyl-ACP methyl ester carboxylesterase
VPRLPEWLLGRDGAVAIARIFTTTACDPARFPPEVLQVYRDQARLPGALTAMLNWYRAAARGSMAAQVKLGYPTVEVPTLMIWGEADEALGKETTYGTHRYVANLKLHYVPGASHWVQQDAPERVNEELRRFLGESSTTEVDDGASRGLPIAR